MPPKGAPKGKRPKSGKGKKEPVEDPVVTAIRKVNDEINAQNAELRDSVAYYRAKLHAVVAHVIDCNVDNYKPAKGIDLVDVPESDVMSMITSITHHPGSMAHTYETRIEELETRVTQLNVELARLLKLKLKVENGLKDMEEMYTVEDLRVQGKRLWYDCCSTRVFVVPIEALSRASISDGHDTTLSSMSISEVMSRPQSGVSDVTRTSMNTAVTNGESMPEIPPLYLNVLNPRARSINLTPRGQENNELEEPPEKKLPGETHIFDMNQNLRSHIIRHLSKRKGNSCDWRLIANRVGIPENLVEQWIRMRAPYAMALVMKVWGDSMGATVRMLHRHLVSPQMKAIVLAKRLADFYEVD